MSITFCVINENSKWDTLHIKTITVHMLIWAPSYKETDSTNQRAQEFKPSNLVYILSPN